MHTLLGCPRFGILWPPLLWKIPDMVPGLRVRSPTQHLSSPKAGSCERLGVLQQAGFACVTYVTVSGGCRQPSRAVPACAVLPTMRFGSRVVLGASFAGLPSTGSFQLLPSTLHPQPPMHPPMQPRIIPPFISSFPFQPHGLHKKTPTPNQPGPHYPGYSAKAGVLPFCVCVRTCACVSRLLSRTDGPLELILHESNTG